jgi:hypothetical protein
MSVIFPTEPAKVNLHMLPKGAEMITYNVKDSLTISAWMPNGFQTVEHNSVTTNDDFFHHHCDDCHRNCYDFLSQYEDEDGEIDWDNPDLQGHCNVYDDGYCGQRCPEGYEKEDEEFTFDVSNMVFSITITHLGNPPRFERVADTAYLQAGRVNEDGNLEATSIRMASNVFGGEDYPEGICWGYNRKPENLRSIVFDYFNAPFNNDLVSVNGFENNCRDIVYCKDNDYYEENYLLDSNERHLVNGADALMLLDAEINIQAFYTMLMAGFRPLPEAPHVMMIPLDEYEFVRDGAEFRGYKTKEDSVGKVWYIHPNGMEEGVLVGQL